MKRETMRKIGIGALCFGAIILFWQVVKPPQFVWTLVLFFINLWNAIYYKNPRFTEKKQTFYKYFFSVLSVVFFLLTIGNFLVWMGIIQDIPLF